MIMMTAFISRSWSIYFAYISFVFEEYDDCEKNNKIKLHLKRAVSFQ